jgi:phage tail sheath gpL-like
VDVDMIKAHLVGRYRQHAARAIVEDVAGFAENVVVERNGTDANRVDILYPPDLANQLNVLAVLMRPYLQYPEA